MMQTIRALLFTLTMMGLFCSATYAAGDEVELTAKQIYGEVYSPFCPGRLLQDCPSSSANELKNQIKSDLASGKTKSEVLQALLEKYGKELGALPAVSGFSSLAWIIPIFFVLGGLLIIRIWLKSNQQAAGSKKSATDPQDQGLDHQSRL
jgi:cytochrome c-type biogenesis protein CcmH